MAEGTSEQDLSEETSESTLADKTVHEHVSAPSKLALHDIFHLTVDQLKAELVSRGIPVATKVTKPELLQKLCELVFADSIPGKSHSVETDHLTHDEVESDISPSNASSPPSSPLHPQVTFKALPNSLAGLKADQIFELERMRIHAEIESKRQQAEAEAESRRLQAEMESKRMQHELELAKLNSANNALASSSAGFGTSGTSSVGNQRLDLLIKLVPRFDPSDVHLFFTSFERAALLNSIPRDRWSAILHAIVHGKAQRVMSSLPLTEVLDYDRVKQALLTAFDVCADVFRKRFRTVAKTLNESFAEFAFKIKETFDRWLQKSDVKDFESLQQLMLLERFNQSFADDSELSIWMLSKDPRTLSEAAQLADEFTAMRRANKPKRQSYYQNSTRSSQSFLSSVQSDGPHAVSQNSSSAKSNFNSEKHDRKRNNDESTPPAGTVKCAYCKRNGHSIQQCFKLKRNRENGAQKSDNVETSQADNCLISTIADRDDFNSHLREFVDHRFRPHCFEVSVIRPDKSELKLTCLRDTAALQSLVRDLSIDREGMSKSDISPHYIATNEYRQICGIGGTPINVPLVQVDLISDQISGMFELGLCNNLPRGIDMLAGNDLFNNCETDTCVVTRSQTAAAERLASD